LKTLYNRLNEYRSGCDVASATWGTRLACTYTHAWAL